jgi:hypothetical protein
MKINGIWYNKDDKDGNDSEKPGLAIEMNMEDIREKFITTTIKCIVDALRVPWKSRDLVEPLIYSAIADNVRNLLEQYLHHELEILAHTFNREFSMNEKINFNYATHAKMNNIIEGIMQRYGRRRKVVPVPTKGG